MPVTVFALKAVRDQQHRHSCLLAGCWCEHILPPSSNVALAKFAIVCLIIFRMPCRMGSCEIGTSTSFRQNTKKVPIAESPASSSKNACCC